jgi:predicted CXXCH cytochrome family protein
MNPQALPRTLGVAVALGAALALALSGLRALGEIENSHHDFSNASWSQEICAPCHTPHGADGSVSDAPLWNHSITSATFTLYSSDTLDATPGQPIGASKLCLSCHDGTIAVDSFGGDTGTRSISSWSRTGTVLSTHHPISFVYDSTLASTDGELVNPSTANSGLGSTIATDLLSNGRLECTSCHDVHIARNTQGCSGCHGAHGPINKESLSLRKSNVGSALCLTCHLK